MPASPYGVAGSSGIIPSFPGLSLTLGHVRNAFLALSPLYSRSKLHFRVRLACFSHAASVRAEPGSNSSIDIRRHARRRIGRRIGVNEGSTYHPPCGGPVAAHPVSGQAGLPEANPASIGSFITHSRPRSWIGICRDHKDVEPTCRSVSTGRFPRRDGCDQPFPPRSHPRGAPNCSLVKDQSGRRHHARPRPLPLSGGIS